MAENATESAAPPNGSVGDVDDGEEEELLLEPTGHYSALSQLLPHRHSAKILFNKYFEAGMHPGPRNALVYIYHVLSSTPSNLNNGNCAGVCGGLASVWTGKILNGGVHRIMVDRVSSISSMLYGRPMGIPYGQFSDYQDLLPRPIDDYYIGLDQTQPADIPSVNMFFRHSVRLYHVMDNVLRRLSDAKSTAYFDLQKASIDMRIRTPISNTNALMSLFSTILQLDGHLLSWHEYLPSHLKFSLDGMEGTAEETPPWIQRQRHHLRSRFLGMRMLLHRQTILFLLQPSERRNWPQNGVQEWPPLFSDCYNDTLVGGHTPFRREGVPSAVEIALTHLSASICVASALLQIEAIERYLGSRIIGEWCDFNYINFVIPDKARAHNAFRRGSIIVQSLSTNPGLPSGKLRQSQRLLEKLGSATMNSSNGKNGLPVASGNQALSTTVDPWEPNTSLTHDSTASINTTAGIAATIPADLQPFPPSANSTPSNVLGRDMVSSSHGYAHEVPQPQDFPTTHNTGNAETVDSPFDSMGSFDIPQPNTEVGEDTFDLNMMNPRTMTSGYDPVMPQIEDSIESLFHHSFDIWGSVDSMDI
ncbi:MAG: hypothetical protein Q9169_005901 [Polycauliona sp. 2 TL-2023]